MGRRQRYGPGDSLPDVAGHPTPPRRADTRPGRSRRWRRRALGPDFNPGGATGDFRGDTFILATEDGTVVGWNNTTDPFDEAGAATAKIEYDNSGGNAIYKGLAIVPATPAILLLADFHNGHIDVLDTSYSKVVTDGGTSWTDPSVPAGYAPFNIVAAGGKVWVSYAKQDAMAKDDMSGVGNGAISVFDMTGALVKSLVKTGGVLNSPWGMTMAPAGWGQLGGNLIVGNFGDGKINAYNPTSGAWMGKLVTAAGADLAIDGLWALVTASRTPTRASTRTSSISPPGQTWKTTVCTAT